MNFLKNIRNFNGADAFLDTMKRFPLSTICCFVGFVILILAIHDVWDSWGIEKEQLARFFLLMLLGYFWFGIVQLIDESHSFNALKRIGLSVTGFIPLALIVFGDTDQFFRLFFIVPALLLLISVAPYILKRSDNDSFWVFNRYVWFGVAVSYLGAMLMSGGIAAAILAVKYLFDISVNEEIFADIFAFSATILGPIYALSFVPKRFDEGDEECYAPVQIGFLTSWILAPLAIVYMTILYAYFIKIGITWEIPKGQLSFMITGFIGVGLATYLTSWPQRETGSKALKLLVKYFFVAMIIPIVMQAISIGMRIEQYGVTEKRYIVAMSVLWFAFIAFGFIFKKLELKHIPLSLALLLLIASWGPWSARDLSGFSQSTRLENLLVDNGLYDNGQLIPVPEQQEIPFEDRKEISSIADYLFKYDHTFKGYENKRDFFDAINVQHISKWHLKSSGPGDEYGRLGIYFSSSVNNGRIIDVRNIDFYASNVSTWSNGEAFIKMNGENFLTLSLEKSVLNVQVEGYGAGSLDLTEVMQPYIKKRASMNNTSKLNRQEPLTIEVDGGRFIANFNVNHIESYIGEDELKINRLTAGVTIKLK